MKMVIQDREWEQIILKLCDNSYNKSQRDALFLYFIW